MDLLIFQPDQTTIEAGSVLSGSLHIHAKRRVKATRVAIYFRGKEYTNVIKGGGKDEHTYHAKHTIVRLDLDGFASAAHTVVQNGFILPGTYIIPFSATLPDNLPPSMTEGAPTGKKSTAKIEYCLRAAIKGSGIFVDYQARKVIKVVPKPVSLPEPVPYTQAPTARTIQRCFNTGEISVGYKVLNPRVAVGQKLQVVLSLRNNCTTIVKSVTLRLQQVVRFEAMGKSTQATTAVAMKTIQMIRNQQHQALSRDQLQEYMANIQSRRAQCHWEMTRELDNANSSSAAQRLEIPVFPQLKDMVPDFQGKFIQVSHRLVLRIQTGDLHTNPEFDVPITILPRAGGGGWVPPSDLAEQSHALAEQSRQVASRARAAAQALESGASQDEARRLFLEGGTAPPMATAFAVGDEPAAPMALAVPVREESARDYPELSVRAVPVN